MATASEGASLEVRYVEPSLDLAGLVACLADAVPPLPATGDGSNDRHAPERSQPLLEWQPEAGVLAVHTAAVFARVPTSKRYRALQPGPEGGFVRDAPVPRTNGRAYLGGHIVEGSGGTLQQAVAALVGGVEDEIDAATRAGFNPATLVQPASRALSTIGGRVRLQAEDFLDVVTRVRRTTMEAVAGTRRGRETEIGRLMAAIEEVEGDRADHFERMAAAVRALLSDAGLSERAITSALEHHREQAQRPGTQLARFFDFLEDAALARVRLEATFLMMEAVATAAGRSPKGDTALLVAYVRRATGLFRALAGADGEELSLNLSRDLGAQADFALHDEVITAGFAGCLPVWPEWVTQLFERQQRGPGPGATSTREVSYRFRVNGVTPEDGLPAFDSRLTRMRKTLLGPDGPARATRRTLAELVFLTAVVPADTATPASAESALAAANRCGRALEAGGSDAVAQALDTLAGRAAVVARVSHALIGILKTVGRAVTASTSGRSWDFYVNVRRSLVDVRRIGFAVDTPLMIPTDSPAGEMAAFFRQIRITADRPLPGHLFSLRVRVRLAEGALRTTPATARASIARDLPLSWAQVAWRPDTPTGLVDGPAILHRAPALTEQRGSGPWLVAPRIEVAYGLRWLGLTKLPSSLDARERQLQLLAAHRCGFSILVYVVLYCLLRRVRRAAAPAETATGERRSLAVSMFRIQRGDRGAGPFGGEQGVFAAAHAVEVALGRDFDVRMHGLAIEDGELTEDKRRGMYGALFAGFPVVIQRIGEAEPEPRVGLIVFGARPCNGHPEQSGLRESMLCVARTYLARSVAIPFRGYRISCDATLCEVRDDGGEAELPSVIVGEIQRLYERERCRHVMVLSHRYGSRRIGWAAARLRAPEFPRLLGDVAARFPGLCLYPLVRDTFPVTRLRERFPGEDAFEILRPDEHVAAYPDAARPLRHDYTPVYSLATLHVVGRRAAKPQSGFCTYFLLRDSGAGSIEAAEQVRANFLLPSSPVRADLIAVLRGIHYLESERPATETRTLQPVLDPYSWLQPETIGHAGEVQVAASRRRAGTVALSLPAALERVSRVLHVYRPSAG